MNYFLALTGSTLAHLLATLCYFENDIFMFHELNNAVAGNIILLTATVEHCGPLGGGGKFLNTATKQRVNTMLVR